MKLIDRLIDRIADRVVEKQRAEQAKTRDHISRELRHLTQKAEVRLQGLQIKHGDLALLVRAGEQRLRKERG